ncbi:phage tail protein [Salmonella enterica]|nr:phage tail protein [Salmonella enterica]EJJ4290082.1 phage tail protein [Salmonella enterica]EJJ4530983.1 phage tail protein [Salmonella enterica]
MKHLSTNQLASLTRYLTDALGERVMQTCNIDTSEVRMINAAKNLGLGFLRTGFDVFDADFTWHDWPYRQFDPDLLTSLLEAWIFDNGEMRDELDLPFPLFDVATGDDDTMTVTMDITLYKDRVIKEDDNGIIRRGGKRYSLQVPEVWVAEDMDITVESRP